jgi:YhcH/YjgK/YiaL family protein
MIKGEEMVGLSLLKDQSISKPYEAETDFMLFADAPSFFAKLSENNFMIFCPTDLHMPCINVNEPVMVKKAVVKVRV